MKPTFKQFLTERMGQQSFMAAYEYPELGKNFNVQYSIGSEYSQGDRGDIYNPPESRGETVEDVNAKISPQLMDLVKQHTQQAPSDFSEMSEDGLMHVVETEGVIPDAGNARVGITIYIYGKKVGSTAVPQRAVIHNRQGHEEYIRDIIEDYLNN